MKLESLSSSTIKKPSFFKIIYSNFVILSLIVILLLIYSAQVLDLKTYFTNNQNFWPPLAYCPIISRNLKGQIDVAGVLKELNLTSLVNFYDDVSFFDRDQYFYFDETNFKYNTNELDHYFRILWNSRNVSILNDSRAFNGIDGNQIELGGRWKPRNCISRFKIGIIIPFRDRLPHLKVNLIFLHMILQRQQLDYRIFVAEPTTPVNVSFNKGRVMNTGK
jgi:hypothetical protein